jgi:hypothetical protein
MRFDDMIATVLAQPEEHPSTISAKWRQLVDLAAQRRGAEAALAWLEERRSEVPLAVRKEAARGLAGRQVTPGVVALFADDHPSVAAQLIAEARLRPEEWTALLPSLSPRARGMLRHRRDLDLEVVQALRAFGMSDLAIGGTVDEGPALTPSAAQNEAQIRELVARIEAFRKHRDESAPASEPAIEPAEAFRWEGGADGTIFWVEGAPRGPLIGQSIAAIAEHGQYGVDGQAAGAFEKRAPFRDARFSVAGSGAASGDWRISGVPFFDPTQGHFLGYRGSARRPRLDEVARPNSTPGGLFGTSLPADSLRQLIHELRTPLNAIVGFAEMIDGQYMGPAAEAYRKRAAQIVDQATKLLSAVDDLDTAARIATNRLEVDQTTTDAVALICRLHDAYERVAEQRGSHVAIEVAPGLPLANVELAVAERIYARLLAATIGLAGEGETMGATMAMGDRGGTPMLCLAIDRPRTIAGLGEGALLDPGYSPEGDWPGAPALGLGFALRLVRNLAEAVGGALIIGGRRFFLYLPAVQAEDLSSDEGG